MKNKKIFRCYLGIGSNLSSPLSQIQKALETLSHLEQCTVIQCSSLYQTKPLGPAQPDFINAVVALDTTLSPQALLDACQEVENSQGRVRTEKWGPRTLDLDILLYGNEILQLPELTIPHYALCERNFVIIPLFEIAPDLILPLGATLHSLHEKIDKGGVTLL